MIVMLGVQTMTKFVSIVRAFASEEDGIALTEYLILLGMLVGGVIAAVKLSGGNLGNSWTKWANFFTQLVP
jgi:pilus assembly protein Flp/PilA